MKRTVSALSLLLLVACPGPYPEDVAPTGTAGEPSGPDLGLLPEFAYGAVYFRKTNPPPEDWERDYRTAAEDGHNTFRHWVFWSAVETRPGVYDWSDYDRHLDLAAEHELVTILGEMLTSAPECRRP